MPDISVVYEKVLDDFKRMGSGRIRRQTNNVLNLINLSRDEKIVEAGVATGKFTSIISKENTVFAVDISLDNLQRTRRTVSDLGNPRNLYIVNCDCSKMPFLDSTLDKVLAIDIIEHLPDNVFDLFCKEAYRVLRKGSSIYIYTPNLIHPYELARPFRPVLRKEHIGVRTRAKICNFLKRTNFKIVRSYFSNCFRRISIEARK